MKKLTYTLVIFTSILFFGLTFSYNPLMANPTDELDEVNEKYLNILTINKEIYSMVKDLVGDKHSVEYLFNSEEEIKNFKINQNVIDNILNMDLFIYNGLDYEEWIDLIVDNSKNSDVGIINSSRGIRPITNSVSNTNKENPYYLLGFNEYKIALYNIKTSLQERDIENRSYYEDNYNNIIKELDEFLSKSKEQLSKYKDYLIFTNSDKFDYLFRDLGLQVNKIKEDSIDKVAVEDISKNNIVKNIFIYDKDKEDLNTLKSKMKEEYTYIGLSSKENKNVLAQNIINIIETIKNKSNINS